ncbi:glycosyltransferase family 4 protein [Candidatus Woesebacteria bacterium]|nr:glycosyltransferase family 4 protein [Candidatus Woesebacteria bacterium]
MKVTHLSHYFWPHIGGIEKHLDLLATELAKDGIETTVITKKYDATLPIEEEHGVSNIYRFETLDASPFMHKLSVWWAIFKLRKHLFEADVIHIHDVFWWLIPLVPFLLLSDKKMYITFHGYEGNKNPNRKQKAWHKCAEFFTKGNLCIGGFHQKYYGVNPTVISFGATKKIKSAQHKKNAAIFVGRLELDNGFLEYVHSLVLLKDVGQNWSLDVYGEGSQLREAKKIVKEHSLKVTFHGFDPDAASYIPHYSVAFVSRYLAILEALSARVPVVAHYDTSIKRDYLLLDCPFAEWIYVARSAEVIADSLATLKPISKEARDWVDAQTWKKMADTYQRLWEV